MRVVVVTQYFPPETGGPQNRLASLASGLVEAGHEVTVLTAKPSYPAGVVFDGFEDGWVVESEYEGIPVLHAWIVPDEEKTALRRLLFYLSFVLSASVTALRRELEADVVLASSPPLTVGIAGWLVSRVTDARFVFDVRDLWPDVAVAMGELPYGWLAGVARRVERFIYRRADGIAAVTQGFCRDIRRRVDGSTPVVRVSNGTRPGVFRVPESKSALRDELDLPGDFLVTYAGNVGLAQGLPHLLDAAESLADEDVTILLLGDGPLREGLKDEARRRHLDNLLFRDRVPLDRAARFMAASDALLVPLRDGPIFGKFIPSKLFDAMAAGRPVLLSVDGEARSILDEAGAGVYYPAEDAEALAAAICRLRSDPRRDALGEAGRRFVTTHFTRAEQARKMVDLVEGIC